MARVMADPAKMRSFANRVGSSATDFKSNYTQMYNVIDNLKNAWTGKDNQAFANKIN
ncbi:MAG: WXG100 family type VII secretion target [Bacilli bacterium]